MDEEEIKLRKKIEKIEKKRKKKERKQFEKDNGIPMFEKAGCWKCYNGQLYSGGKDELSITYYKRCSCANVLTERYKKFLANEDMTVRKHRKMSSKFYDNNSHISEGNNAEERSW